MVYDRNLQALVDKVFPHFAEQVDIHPCSTFDIGFSFRLDHNSLPCCQDKILEEQFYATCEQEEAANNSNLVVRSRLLPQSAPVKRQLPVQDNGKHNPNKKPNNSESSGSSKGAPVSVGSAPAQDVQGLTLRVIPFEDSSSTIPPADALPSLTKPLLRVTARSVTVDKIQRFIHKRMGVPSTFCPADIELLRDGIVLDQTSTITELPIPPPTDDGTGAIAVATQVAKAESVIILAYRKKS